LLHLFEPLLWLEFQWSCQQPDNPHTFPARARAANNPNEIKPLGPVQAMAHRLR